MTGRQAMFDAKSHERRFIPSFYLESTIFADESNSRYRALRVFVDRFCSGVKRSVDAKQPPIVLDERVVDVSVREARGGHDLTRTVWPSEGNDIGDDVLAKRREPHPWLGQQPCASGPCQRAVRSVARQSAFSGTTLLRPTALTRPENVPDRRGRRTAPRGRAPRPLHRRPPSRSCGQGRSAARLA